MTTMAHKFVASPTAARLAMIRDPSNEADLLEFLGEDAFDEYRRLAVLTGAEHLSIDAPPNLVFVPGVMGSLLESRSRGGVWWLDVRTRNHLNDLRLSDDGSSDYDRNNQIKPFNVDSTYDPFLTAGLRRDDIGVRTFDFDWRKLLDRSAADFASEVESLHTENGGTPLTLVGHSMGGLLIRAALMTEGERIWPKIARILFIGTPHYGSPAIAGYLKNHLWGFDMLALLGLYLERATFRSLWGVIAMLPAPAGLYPGTRPGEDGDFADKNDPYNHPCANFDLYSATSWALDLRKEDVRRLQSVLDGARDFHERMAEAHSQLHNDQLEKMRMIAGVGQKTLFRLQFDRRLWGAWEQTKKITDRVPGNDHREGDGRVPLASAKLANVETYFVKGVHGGLPNIPAVYRATFDFVAGKPIALARTPEEALSSHLAGEEKSDAPVLDGTAAATNEGEGLWKETDEPALRALQAQLEDEHLPAFNYVRLL